MPTCWLHVLVYQDFPGVFIARSLEHDIAVEGSSLERAVDWILRIIKAHVEFDQRHGRQALSTFQQAPARFWTAFEQATILRTVCCGTASQSILIAFSSERPASRSLPLKVLLGSLPTAEAWNVVR